MLLCGYVGALLWMRQMTSGQPAPRFLIASSGPLAGPVSLAPLTTAAAGSDAVRPPAQRLGQR